MNIKNTKFWSIHRKEIAEAIRQGADCLVAKSGSFEQGLDIALETFGKGVWYVVPRLTPFRVEFLKAARDVQIAAMTVWQMDKVQTAEIAAWSPKVLRDCLPDLAPEGPLAAPAILVVEDIGDAEEIACMEELLLGLPPAIPILARLAPAPNVAEIAEWLEILRGRACRVWEDKSPSSLAPAFLTPGWKLIPLLDKKRLAKQVKETIKKDDFLPVETSGFMSKLSSLLKKEGLAPALAVMAGERDCEAAFQHYPNGRVLKKSEGIAAIVEKHPWVNAHPRLSAMLTKRAGIFSASDHPVWRMLAETLLLSGDITLVFISMKSIAEWGAPVKTVMMLTSRMMTYEGKEIPIRKQEIDCFRSMAGAGETPGCLLLTHTPELDVMHVRNLWFAHEAPIASRLRMNSQTALGLLAQPPGNVPSLLRRSLSACQINRVRETRRIQEVMDDLAMELANGKCVSSMAAMALAELRISLEYHVNAIKNKQKYSGRYRFLSRHELHKLKADLACLPCHDCPHESLCHKRNTKRMRVLADEYYALRHASAGSTDFLEVEFFYYFAGLRELDFVDADRRLNETGRLALRSGVAFPQILAVCAQQNVLPLDDPYLGPAAAAGFVDCPEWEQPVLAKTFLTPELLTVYKDIDAVIASLRNSLLRTGFIAGSPDLARSAAVMAALTAKGNLDYVANRMKMSLGALVRLLDKSSYLLERLRSLDPAGEELF